MRKFIYIIIAIIVITILGYSMIPKTQSQAPQDERSTITEPVAINNATSSIENATTTTTYTLEDVNKHNSATDCWIAIDGKVYNATQFIASGEHNSKILKGCGIDASEMFRSVKKHIGNKAQDMLPTLYIGELE